VKAIRTLKPGEPGTKKLYRKYGKALYCVRYRYDKEKKLQLKTIELIIDERTWKPRKEKFAPNKKIFIRIRYGEIELARRVKSVGGVWNKQKKLWELPYFKVRTLGLENRIVQ